MSEEFFEQSMDLPFLDPLVGSYSLESYNSVTLFEENPQETLAKKYSCESLEDTWKQTDQLISMDPEGSPSPLLLTTPFIPTQNPIEENTMSQNFVTADPIEMNPEDSSSEIRGMGDQSNCLKNFLVIGSGWLRNFFINLFEKSIIPQQTFKRFQGIVCPSKNDHLLLKKNKRSRRPKKYKKIYINLKTLSLLFNQQLLKPHLSLFLDTYFLRYLSTSKTKNKSCLLRFLPVLKKGLIEGRISHLR